MGDWDGRMYPFSKFSFMNLSISICSSGVRLYDLNDFGWNPSFNSILWSHIRGSGKWLAFLSSKRPSIHGILQVFAVPKVGLLSFRRLLNETRLNSMFYCWSILLDVLEQWDLQWGLFHFRLLGIVSCPVLLLRELPRFLDFWLRKDHCWLNLGYGWQVLSPCRYRVQIVSRWHFGYYRNSFVFSFLSIWIHRFSNRYRDFPGTTRESPGWSFAFLVPWPKGGCSWFVHWSS